jgi:hypothetical protein
LNTYRAYPAELDNEEQLKINNTNLAIRIDSESINKCDIVTSQHIIVMTSSQRRNIKINSAPTIVHHTSTKIRKNILKENVCLILRERYKRIEIVCEL